ncbi:MAG: transglutaminase-like domain-containing protein [Gemmatimonadales bacterium]
MTRRRWAGAILAAWAVALGWLVRREVFRPAATRLAEGAFAVAPAAAYYRVEVEGRQVGFASSTIDTLPDSLRVSDLVVLDVPILGRMQRTTARSVAMLSRTLRLGTLLVRVDSDAGRYWARGHVVSDSLLRLVIVSAGDSQVTRIPLREALVLPSLLPLRLSLGGQLRRGQRHDLRVLDPVVLTTRRTVVSIGAESLFVVADSAEYDSTAMAWVPVHFDSLRALRLDQMAGGVRVTAWADAGGRLARATSPAGLVLERSAFEIAYENFRRRDIARAARGSVAPPAGAIVPATALRAGITTPPEPRSVFRVRLLGVDLTGLALEGGRQVLAGDTLVVRQESPEPQGPPLPLAPLDSALATALRAEPLIGSDDPRIQAQARQLVGGDRDARRVAEKLVHWVHQRLRRTTPTGPPSAVEALERRLGDCNEATVLYVALARAAGLPARAVAGLVYLNGRFYYHAWPEVYLRDWVAVDPLFDRFPADAARLRLAVDALARHLDLLRVTGSLRLDVQ